MKQENVLETALLTAEQANRENEDKALALKNARSSMVEFLAQENSLSKWANLCRKNPNAVAALVDAMTAAGKVVNTNLVRFVFTQGHFHALEAQQTEGECERKTFTPKQFEALLVRLISCKYSPLQVLAIRQEYGTIPLLPKGKQTEGAVKEVVNRYRNSLIAKYEGLDQ
jgi:hypothetical protein